MASPRGSPSYRVISSSTSPRAAAAFSRSSTSRMRSASSGTSAANSRASTTSTGFGTRRLHPLGVRRCQMLAFDHDVSEQLGLLRADLPLPAQLEDGEQADHDL